MQSFNYICYLYICAIVCSIHNEVLNESLPPLDGHFSYLNNLNLQNLSIVENASAMHRKVGIDMSANNKLKLSTDKQSFPEPALTANLSNKLQEESQAGSLSEKLVAWRSNDNMFWPIADINRLKLNMEYLFSYARNSVSNMTAKTDIQHHIINSFKMNNMQTSIHKFLAVGLSSSESPTEGINIIGIRPGKYRSTGEDSIVLIGAHYDTVANTSGVNDNGSGMSALLEVARLIDSHNCQLSHTIIFVAFDLEEYGGIGSRYFVHEYLIPYELISRKSKFEGAFILDTILNFNQTLGSQDIPYDVHKAVPEWSKQIKTNGFVGDFLAVIYRNNIDSKLANHLSNSWSLISKQTPYKLSQLSISSLSSKTPDFNTLSNHANLLRSDHIMFWYPNSTLYNDTLRAVLITDTGPFRGYMRNCYHMSCDNTSHINDMNLGFLKLTVEALTRTAVELSLAECSEHSTASVKSSLTNNNLSSMPYIAFLSYTLFISFLHNSMPYICT